MWQMIEITTSIATDHSPTGGRMAFLRRRDRIAFQRWWTRYTEPPHG